MNFWCHHTRQATWTNQKFITCCVSCGKTQSTDACGPSNNLWLTSLVTPDQQLLMCSIHSYPSLTDPCRNAPCCWPPPRVADTPTKQSPFRHLFKVSQLSEPGRRVHCTLRTRKSAHTPTFHATGHFLKTLASPCSHKLTARREYVWYPGQCERVVEATPDPHT